MKRSVLIMLGVVLALSCLARGADDLPVFKDVTKQAGPFEKNSYGDSDLSNIVEGSGSGACSSRCRRSR